MERLDKYEIRKLLGSVSFGDVYLAWDPVLEREVALKVLDAVIGRDSAAVEGFFREASPIRVPYSAIFT